MNKKLTLLLLIFSACCVNYLILSYFSNDVDTKNRLVEETQSYASQESEHTHTVLPKLIPESTKIEVPKAKSRPNNLGSERVSDGEIWKLSETAREVLTNSPFLPADLNGEVYLEIDVDEIKSLEMGDNYEVYIPQLEASYVAEVDVVTLYPNGDKTIEAYFPESDKGFSVVITTGKGATFGEVSLPSGQYILESAGQYAWMANRQDMIKNHIEEHVIVESN
jgi:hypothetical protein